MKKSLLGCGNCWNGYFEQLENVGLTPQLEVPAVTIGLIRKFLRLLNPN